MKNCISHFIVMIMVTSFALFLLDKYNVFSTMSFIPEDKLFDVALPLYVGALELVCHIFFTLLKTQKSSIKITFFCRGNSQELGVNPTIFFNKENLAEIYLSITLSGKKRAFQGKKIRIPAIDFASMQPGKKIKYVTLDDNGNLNIDLQSLFGEVNKTSESSIDISIAYIQEEYYDNREIDISPQFIGRRLYCFGYVQYEHNQYRIQIKSK